MQKKIDTQDLDIPVDDIECWNRYPKYNWVYDLSRLLDAQHIKWSPFAKEDMQTLAANMFLESSNNVPYVPAYIYLVPPVGKQLIVEAYLVKGEVKHMRFADKDTKNIITESTGNAELRISAFIAIHFQKFTGVISAEIIGSNIYSIKLKPHPELALTAPIILKVIRRIYKKNDNLIDVSDIRSLDLMLQ